MPPLWVSRLERRLSWLAVPGLASFLTAMSAVVGLLSLFKPEFPLALALDPGRLLEGEAWRALTHLLIPPTQAPLWLLFWLMLYYACIKALEDSWGDFALTLYCLLGAGAGTAAALLTGRGLASAPFHTSQFLAFARLAPDYEILLFFVLPVKVRWLAVAAWLALAWMLVAGGAAGLASVVAGTANYLLFFGPDHWRDLRRAWKRRR